MELSQNLLKKTMRVWNEEEDASFTWIEVTGQQGRRATE
jgi:hypothetical protein